MRVARLVVATFSIAVQRDLAYRGDFVAQLVVTSLGVGGSFLALAAIFSHVHTLAGWRYEQTVVVLGSYLIVQGVLNAFVEPNLLYFGAAKVRSGNLDDDLLKPVPSVLYVSLASCRPQALVDLLTGISIVAVASLGHRVSASPAGAGAYIVLVAVGVVVTWALRVVMASVSFFAVGTELSAGFSGIWQLGRYPLRVYGRHVATLLTYCVPLAFVSTIPARALTGDVSVRLVLAGLLAAGGSIVVAVRIWHAGLRRYTSATS